MTWIDLGNPVPRSSPQSYSPFQWQESDATYLTAPALDVELPALNSVLDRRRTGRSFAELAASDLSQWLWFVAREMGRSHSQLGFPLTRRPVPSAGAIHPIHILVSDANSNFWQRYIPDQHAVISVTAPIFSGAEMQEELAPLLDIQEGRVIWLLAEPGKTAAKYENSCSLVWRDAGVLLGQMAIVAEALSLNFCPLGITGQNFLQTLDQEKCLAGVGLAVLGSRR